MSKHLRRIIAGLTLTAVAATGYALTDNLTAAAPPDTTWGAGDTALDTTWGTPPNVDADVDGTVSVVVTPLDTTWG
jgi:hypothetical protein